MGYSHAKPTEEDVKLNKDRKLCLDLLFKLCGACWKKNTVAEADVVETSKLERILNILQVSLAMDRAQAMYKMKYIGSTSYGMHWVAQQHIDCSSNWASFLDETQKPTLNQKVH